MEKTKTHYHEHMIDEKEETKSKFVYITNKSNTNAFGFIMHIAAGGILIYGFINTSITTTTSIQQSVQALWQIKYILYAILFEIVALNCCTNE